MNYSHFQFSSLWFISSRLSKFSARQIILEGTIYVVTRIIPIFYSHPRGPSRPDCPRIRLDISYQWEQFVLLL